MLTNNLPAYDKGVNACKVPGCERTIRAKRLCPMHYKRVHTRGAAGPGTPLRAENGAPWASIEEAIRSKTDGCIIWPHGKLRNGYGLVNVKSEVCYAHRIVLEAVKGPPSRACMQAAHAPIICHSRACVNPRHLRWATKTENQKDRIIDGTSNAGERHPNARLGEEEVRALRASADTPKALAARYGVATRYIRGIIRGAAWKHLL